VLPKSGAQWSHFLLLRLANCAFKAPSSRSLAARRDKIFEIGLVELCAGYFSCQSSIDRSYRFTMEALADTSLLIPCSEGNFAKPVKSLF
jgi:hypothetical protein